MVEYKNYDEQVEILKSRGLLISNETQAKYILKVNNYYNVVNAYKDIFIQKGFTPERFIDGADENCVVEKQPKMEGRSMAMYLAPKA